MSQSKPSIANRHEAAITTVVDAVQAIFTDPVSLRYYADRDIKPSDIQAYLDAVQKWNNLLAAANAKTVR